MTPRILRCLRPVPHGKDLLMGRDEGPSQRYATQHPKRSLNLFADYHDTHACLASVRVPVFRVPHTVQGGPDNWLTCFSLICIHPSSCHLSMPGNWCCPHPSCKKICRSPGSLTQHLNSRHKHHEKFGKRDIPLRRVHHPLVDGQYMILAVL